MLFDVLNHGLMMFCNLDNGQFTEFWLITDYHERGSLFDWLSHSTASIPEAILMMYTGKYKFIVPYEFISFPLFITCVGQSAIVKT